jgi:hypothetical protein
VLNEAAAKAAEYGLRVGYHNHDHEFTSRSTASAYEVFADCSTRPSCSSSTSTGRRPPARTHRRCWVASVTGSSPYTSRTAPCVRASRRPTCPKTSSRRASGDVPLAESLQAASGIEYAVVEFDKYAGDIFEGIAGSYAFLSDTLKG